MKSSKKVIDPIIFDAHFAHIIDEHSNHLTTQGVPQNYARNFARLPILANTLDVVKLSEAQGIDQKDVAKAYFGITKQLQFSELTAQLTALPTQNNWDTKAITALRQELGRSVLALTQDVLRAGGLDRWQSDNHNKINNFHAKKQHVIKEPSLASLSVLLSDISGLKQI